SFSERVEEINNKIKGSISKEKVIDTDEPALNDNNKHIAIVQEDSEDDLEPLDLG
ncbi:1896_t:CDS:1, partial [Rhizophagus irregularis]